MSNNQDKETISEIYKTIDKLLVVCHEHKRIFGYIPRDEENRIIDLRQNMYDLLAKEKYNHEINK